MKLAELDKERSIRFYRWALKDFEREVEQDYPLVSRIQSLWSIAYVDVARTLPLEEQLFLARLRVKLSHRVAMGCTLENLSAEELAWHKRFSEALTRELPLVQRAIDGRDGEPIKLRKLKNVVIEHLSPILGAQFERTAESLRFTTPCGARDVVTSLDFFRHRMSYAQCVRFSEREFAAPLEHQNQKNTSILFWMGIGRSEWTLTLDKDIEPAAKSLADVCAHFLKEVPPLFEDLVVDE